MLHRPVETATHSGHSAERVFLVPIDYVEGMWISNRSSRQTLAPRRQLAQQEDRHGSEPLSGNRQLTR